MKKMVPSRDQTASSLNKCVSTLVGRNASVKVSGIVEDSIDGDGCSRTEGIVKDSMDGQEHHGWSRTPRQS